MKADCSGFGERRLILVMLRVPLMERPFRIRVLYSDRLIGTKYLEGITKPSPSSVGNSPHFLDITRAHSRLMNSNEDLEAVKKHISFRASNNDEVEDDKPALFDIELKWVTV